MDHETRESMLIWKHRADEIPDPFVQFFILYMCLDNWMTIGSGLANDQGKKHWIEKNGNLLSKYWSEAPHLSLEHLHRLKELSPIEDLRPTHRGHFTNLDDIDDFRNVVDFIYQIRCNLFHGGKNASRSRDSKLVDYSSRVLREWIDFILHSTA